MWGVREGKGVVGDGAGEQFLVCALAHVRMFEPACNGARACVDAFPVREMVIAYIVRVRDLCSA